MEQINLSPTTLDGVVEAINKLEETDENQIKNLAQNGVNHLETVFGIPAKIKSEAARVKDSIQSSFQSKSDAISGFARKSRVPVFAGIALLTTAGYLIFKKNNTIRRRIQGQAR